MAKTTAPLLPATSALLQAFGERLRLARLRRRLTANQVAARAGMAPMTLRNLERGGAGVTIGAYLAVMQVLGMEKDFDLLAAADTLGRELQDARLPAGRAPISLGAAAHVAPSIKAAGANKKSQASIDEGQSRRGAKAASISSKALAELIEVKASRKPRR